MDAFTDVEVGLDERGHTVVRRMHCEAPFLVRVVQTGRTLGLAMVNGAAGPLGGDRLRFRLSVGPGADVVVSSVAAAMAQPGPHGRSSTTDYDITVGAGATMRWAPEPTVSVTGSDHRTDVRLATDATSTVSMRESVSLGRHGEAPGRLAMHQRVTIDGVAILDHETVFAVGALSGPGAHGIGRTVTSEVCVGSESRPTASHVTDECAGATFRLSDLCSLTITSSSR